MKNSESITYHTKPIQAYEKTSRSKPVAYRNLAQIYRLQNIFAVKTYFIFKIFTWDLEVRFGIFLLGSCYSNLI
jgi:hypothetical protein